MRLLVLGANSDVADATARQFAQQAKADLILASRNLELLEKKARDIHTRYDVTTQAVAFDALDHESHTAFYDHLEPKPDGVVVAFGHMGDQQAAQVPSRFWKSSRRISSDAAGDSSSALHRWPATADVRATICTARPKAPCASI